MKRLTYLCFVALSVTAVACGKDHKKRHGTSSTSTTGTGGSGGNTGGTGGTGGDGSSTVGGSGGTGGNTGGSGGTAGTGGSGGTAGTGGSGGTGGMGAGGAPGGAGGEGGEGATGTGGSGTGGSGTGGTSTEMTPCESACANKALNGCTNFNEETCVTQCDSNAEYEAGLGCGDEIDTLNSCIGEANPEDFTCNTDTGLVGIDSSTCPDEQNDEYYCLYYALYGS